MRVVGLLAAGLLLSLSVSGNFKLSTGTLLAYFTRFICTLPFKCRPRQRTPAPQRVHDASKMATRLYHRHLPGKLHIAACLVCDEFYDYGTPATY